MGEESHAVLLQRCLGVLAVAVGLGAWLGWPVGLLAAGVALFVDSYLA
ncbi:MAG TPA: hypothetical protein VM487_18270 [Phycisphaerae bacterium]|nr:hypothetical protein [Phycisphaerae bacterium]